MIRPEVMKMMLVSEQEMKLDLSRYLDMAADDDITITRGGKAIATLSRARISREAQAARTFPSDEEVVAAAHRMIDDNRELFEALAR